MTTAVWMLEASAFGLAAWLLAAARLPAMIGAMVPRTATVLRTTRAMALAIATAVTVEEAAVSVAVVASTATCRRPFGRGGGQSRTAAPASFRRRGGAARREGASGAGRGWGVAIASELAGARRRGLSASEFPPAVSPADFRARLL